MFAQACVLGDERELIGSLRASAGLTRRRWWRTFGFATLLALSGIAILSGPLLGVLILLLTPRVPHRSSTSPGSIVYTLVVPYAAIALTLYYFDLQQRPAAAPARRASRTGGTVAPHANETR